jgi:hypothetical protein
LRADCFTIELINLSPSKYFREGERFIATGLYWGPVARHHFDPLASVTRVANGGLAKGASNARAAAVNQQSSDRQIGDFRYICYIWNHFQVQQIGLNNSS